MDNCNLYNCFGRVAIGALMAESRSAFEIFLTAFNAENKWYYPTLKDMMERPGGGFDWSYTHNSPLSVIKNHANEFSKDLQGPHPRGAIP